MHAYVRKEKRIPPGTRIASLAGLTFKRVNEIERGIFWRTRAPIKE